MKFKTPFSEPVITKKRFEDTKKFIVYPDKKVLVVGGGEFEKMLEEHWLKKFDYTDKEADLNWGFGFIWKVRKLKQKQYYETILCFQVIEHLLNPLLFLSECRNFLTDDGILYVSYPAHLTKMYWNSGHFHEYDRSRFLYLIKEAGFKVVKYQKRFMWSSLNNPLKWCWHNYYKLEKI